MPLIGELGNITSRSFGFNGPAPLNLNAATMSTMSANAISKSYAALYLMATDQTIAIANQSKMQGNSTISAQSETAMQGRGLARRTHTQNWSFSGVYPGGYTSGVVMVGGSGTDDGDSNAYYYSNGTQVYGISNVNFTRFDFMGFYAITYSMGGGSVGTATVYYYYLTGTLPLTFEILDGWK